jgi:hypothetical protein
MYEQFTIKEIRQIQREYPSLRYMSESYVTTLYNTIQEKYYLTEFELQTINISKTLETLNSRFKDKIVASAPSKYHNRIIHISLNTSDIKNNLKEVNDFMVSFGWFLSMINGKKYPDTSSVKTDDKGRVLLQYEEKMGKEIKPNEPYIT